MLAILKKPVSSWPDLVKGSPRPLVVLDGVQDPGNLAAILRTSEASGASGIVTTPGTARLFSPKALRGAMGSSLRLPILEHQPLTDISKELKQAGYQLVGTASGDGMALPCQNYAQFDWTPPLAIILGHEGQGLAKAWSAHLNAAVHIPMASPVDSLNVASAAAVLLYESHRRRT